MLLGGIAQEKVVERDYQGALARKHTALRTLRCFYCGVRNRGAQAIARVLPATRLSRLDPVLHDETEEEHRR